MLGQSPTALLRYNAVGWKYRCLQSQQIRRLKLLHELFVQRPFPICAKNQALLDARQFKDLSSTTNIELNLYSPPMAQPERLTLSEIQDRLRPLHHLSLSTHRVSPTGDLYRCPVDKKLYITNNKTYEILPLKLPKDFIPTIIPDALLDRSKRTPSGRPVKRHQFIHAGRGVQIHLTPTSPPSHLGSILARAYRGLLQGCRIEFHLHQKSNDVRLKNTVDWVLEHSLHLRPDVILRAMPEGTEMLALPAVSKSDKLEELTWALELPETLKKAGHTTPSYIKKRAMGELPRTTNDISKAV